MITSLGRHGTRGVFTCLETGTSPRLNSDEQTGKLNFGLTPEMAEASRQEAESAEHGSVGEMMREARRNWEVRWDPKEQAIDEPRCR